MSRNTLVIIPENLFAGSMSGPLAWLFSGYSKNVYGIYSIDLKEQKLSNFDLFIIELNWYTQLDEFLRIVRYIKNNYKRALILFGGLFAAICYKEIFKMSDVDFFIKGDNEVPIQMLLESRKTETIPNLVGRNFENPHSYVFDKNDINLIEYDFSWFPTRVELPSWGYPLPMVYTVKSGCLACNETCSYCLGSKLNKIKQMYNRKPILLDNNSVINLINKVQNKGFKQMSLQICSNYQYDLRNHYFDIECTIEYDNSANFDSVKNVIHSFKKTLTFVSVYEDGLTGKLVRDDLYEIAELNCSKHRIYFNAFHDFPGIDYFRKNEMLRPSEHILPGWADYSVYSNIHAAKEISRKILFFYSKGKFLSIHEKAINKSKEFLLKIRGIVFKFNKRFVDYDYFILFYQYFFPKLVDKVKKKYRIIM